MSQQAADSVYSLQFTVDRGCEAGEVSKLERQPPGLLPTSNLPPLTSNLVGLTLVVARVGKAVMSNEQVNSPSPLMG